MKKKKYNNKRSVFLDRDGTINYDFGYVHKFSNFKFKPHVIKGLQYLTGNKYLIFIVTNQAGLAKGKFQLSDLLRLNKKLNIFFKKKRIKISRISYCPYHPKGLVKKYTKKSIFRKPGNGMIREIVKKWNIDCKKSFMIGDKVTDKIAAKKSSLYFQYAKKNFYTQIKNIEKKIFNNC